MSASTKPAYDVVVLGGGPAGSAAALSLRRSGAPRVLVVDARSAEAIHVGESIPPDTRHLLQRLGVFTDFLGEQHEPCLGSCSSWGSGELGYNDYLFNVHGTGWHLDRRAFDSFLARKAADAGAELRRAARFDGVQRDGGGDFVLRVSTGDGALEEIRARFVIDATGKSARFARRMGARHSFHDRLTCVVAFMDLPAASRLSRLTMLEAVEYGWWYAARLPGGRLAVAVASDPEIVKRAELHTREGWLARLQETAHVAGEIAGCVLDGGVSVCAAPSFILDRTAGDGWLVVGDAASAYDPISSQGIYKALLDGLLGAEAAAGWLGGDARKLEAHHAAVAARFASYLRNRNHFYGVEQRWPSAPFWRRRRERASAAPHAGEPPSS